MREEPIRSALKGPRRDAGARPRRTGCGTDGRNPSSHRDPSSPGNRPTRTRSSARRWRRDGLPAASGRSSSDRSRRHEGRTMSRQPPAHAKGWQRLEIGDFVAMSLDAVRTQVHAAVEAFLDDQDISGPRARDTFHAKAAAALVAQIEPQICATPARMRASTLPPLGYEVPGRRRTRRSVTS